VKSLNKIVISVGLLGLGWSLAPSVYAQFYLGVGAGQAHASVPSLNTTVLGLPVTASATKSNDTSYKIYGGYQFTKNWGVEVGYNDLGNGYNVNFNFAGLPGSGSVKIDNWYVAGTGTLPLGDRFSVFAKLGAVANHSDVLVGVGAQYAFTRNWSARLEYEDYGKVSSDDVWGTGGSGSVKANAWYLSAKYSF
jgi:OOP family OmpA-OmpF porin